MILGCVGFTKRTSEEREGGKGKGEHDFTEQRFKYGHGGIIGRRRGKVEGEKKISSLEHQKKRTPEVGREGERDQESLKTTKKELK